MNHMLRVLILLLLANMAFGSIRMEQVFMVLGQSAAAAASLCVDNHTNVHGLAYEKLKNTLIEHKQHLKAKD